MLDKVKILFCDVDGVLNSPKDFNFTGEVDPLNEGNCSLLKEVLVNTGAYVVLSSTWRKDDGFLMPQGIITGWRKLLDRNVLTKEQLGWEIFGFDFKTPVLPSGVRGEEIKLWLDKYGENVERYAIVDDDSDMLPEQLPFFVKTNNRTGLTQFDADKLVEILND